MDKVLITGGAGFVGTALIKRLLKKYPILNAYFENNTVRMYNDINIGVAFDIDNGLKVFTIKNTEQLSISSIEKSISIGNLLGSNIFNVFAVLGITSIITPLIVNDLNIINFDIYVMLFFAAIILPLMFFPKKFVLGRIEGFIMLSFYCIYIYTLFI